MHAFGLVLLSASALVYLWCVGLFALRGRGTTLPAVPPRELLGSLARLAASGLAFGILHLYVTRREEPLLVRRFGEPCLAYCRRAPRWLPGTQPREAAA